MWSRTYCCCAIPLYNSGIYAILTQFFVVSLVSGVLTFAAPKIAAVAIPSWGPDLFGAVCLIVSVVQILGFFGVYRERPSLFKNYARLNAALVSAALLIAVAFIALSASRHSTAITKCEAYFSEQVASNTTSAAASAVQSGSEICNIWTWVQVGIMGLLFLIVAVCEIYFLMYQSIYASEQRLDHARYDEVVEQAAEEIRQSGLWDASGPPRPSAEFAAPGYGHVRNPSGLRNEVGRNDDMYADAYQEEEEEDLRDPRYNSGTYANQGSAYASSEYTAGGKPGGEGSYYAQPPTVEGSYGAPPRSDGYGGYGGGSAYPEKMRAEHPLDAPLGRQTPNLPSPTETALTGNINWDPAIHGYQPR